jgi:inward rectifier potassium channel
MQDLYHLMMATSWLRLLAWCLATYLLLNGAFAGLYYLQPGCIVNAPPHSYPDAFWFSVQTFATIGFGVMSPANTYAHVLVTLESFLGLFSLALGTGLVFAKFSRPSARLGFSNNLLVTLHDGKPCLCFRVAHQRHGSLLDVHAKMSALVDEVTAEGVLMRRAYELELERSSMPMLAMAWTLIHVLGESSPLHGLNVTNAPERVVAFFVTVTGVDQNTLETQYSGHVYAREALEFGVRFVDMIERRPAAPLLVHHDRLSQTVPCKEWLNPEADG